MHRGWRTDDHQFCLLGDEMDEIDLGLSTRTGVFDISDLDAPAHLYAHDLGTRETDVNLFVFGDTAFEANYTSLLCALRFGDLAARQIEEVAFFDTFPEGGEPGTEGAWSVNPYLPSGTILAGDIANELFVITMDYRASPTPNACTPLHPQFPPLQLPTHLSKVSSVCEPSPRELARWLSEGDQSCVAHNRCDFEPISGLLSCMHNKIVLNRIYGKTNFVSAAQQSDTWRGMTHPSF